MKKKPITRVTPTTGLKSDAKARGDSIEPDPRPIEHGLHEHGRPEHPAEAQSNHGEGREKGVLQGVKRDDPAGVDAVRPRRDDVIRLQHLDHLGPVYPQDRSQARERENNGRKDDMRERLAERLEVASEKSVDKQQVSDRLRGERGEGSRPETGRSSRRTAKNSCSRMPNQKAGSATPEIERMRVTWSIKRSL